MRKLFHKNQFETILGGPKTVVRIGGRDKTTRKRFIPNINASFKRKFVDEFYLNINADDVIVSNEVPVISKELGITVGDRTDKFFVNPDGTLEYEIVLDKKPAANVIALKIDCSSGLRFSHQPELTQAEVEEGSDRPVDIINSYAIFCDKGNNEYLSGKIGHIKRSYVVAKDSKKTWCSQSISVNNGTGRWEITIPQAVYENEKLYPLTIGPNVGFESEGGSFTWMRNPYISLVECSPAMTENGTLDSVSIFTLDVGQDSGEMMYSGLYDTSLNLIAENAENALGDPTGDIWVVGAANDENLSDGVEYCVAFETENDTILRVAYDTDSASDNNGRDGHTYDASWPDPTEFDSQYADRKYSAYYTYTAAGGSPEVTKAGALTSSGAASRHFAGSRNVAGEL